MYSSLLSISLISTIATLAVADNLFTDWTSDSNLGADLSFDSSNSNDANGLSFGDGADPGNQLLAFNDNGASNPFTADSSFQSTDLGGNQASTAPLSDDTTNWFLDSTPLSPTDNGALDTSFLDNLALPDLPNGSPDLLANNAAGGCSSFAPSSRRRRNTEQLEGACTAEGMTQAEFLKKGAFAQDAIFRTLVCPATDFGVTVPVCSSRDPQKSTFFGADSAFNPNAHTLADSNLMIWSEAFQCFTPRKPFCCGSWMPNIFAASVTEPEKLATGTGYDCYEMFQSSDIFQHLPPGSR